MTARPSPIVLVLMAALSARGLAEPFTVHALVETRSERRGGDTDDACIWIHPTDPSRSLVIGTDKKLGALHAYDLTGRLVQEVRPGLVNNVDLRQGFPLDGREVALLTAGNRTDDSIAIYMVDEDGTLVDVASGKTRTLAVYGSCMYRSGKSARYYYFADSKEGDVEQYELSDDGHGKVAARKVPRMLRVPSQAEGCVADDELGHLYLSEEGKGIWKFGAEPGDGTTGTLVDTVGDHLTPDIEGLTIYRAAGGAGYLIASSQGDSSYAVYRREGDNAYLKSFRIGDGDVIDGTDAPDGIDVTSVPLPGFPEGLFVSHDGQNSGPGKGSVNFKLVSWGDIAKAGALGAAATGVDPGSPPGARTPAAPEAAGKP